MCQFVSLLSATIGLIVLAIASVMTEPMRGHNMEPANIPFVVSIAKKANSRFGVRKHYASGSLIAKDLVLTAGHSVGSYKYDEVDVVIGAADLKSAKFIRYEVHSWITFGQWIRNREWELEGIEPNDIALIKLKSQVIDVTPAKITTLAVDDLYGKNVTLVGWAAAKNGLARFLNQATVRILTAIECKRRSELDSNSTIPFPGGTICTIADWFTLLTPGDSGAPLLDENNVILAVNLGVCTGNAACKQQMTDEQQFNMHTYFLEEYRRFIDEMKANWVYIRI